MATFLMIIVYFIAFVTVLKFVGSVLTGIGRFFGIIKPKSNYQSYRSDYTSNNNYNNSTSSTRTDYNKPKTDYRNPANDWRDTELL